MGRGIAIAGIWIGTGIAMAFGHLESGAGLLGFVCALLATIVVSAMPWKG
jgi:hypothetical protein